MKTLNRSLFLLLALTLLSFVVPPVSAQDFAVENGKITLPSTVIRGDYNEVLAHQRIVVKAFLGLVDRSPYELVDTRHAATLDGFLRGIVPIYSPKLKSSRTQSRVLIFTRGTPGMWIFLERGADALREEILRSGEDVNEMWAVPDPVRGEGFPIFIWVKTKSTVVST
ncbi:MAG: hypothetical protein WBL19_00930 [Minisyncoccia bacterium]